MAHQPLNGSHTNITRTSLVANVRRPECEDVLIPASS
jgi:hypothetical protein